MHDTAAHLVDRVLPHLPVRHLVLTFPHRIRWHLAQDPKLASQALRLFVPAEPPDALQLTLAAATGEPSTSAFEPRPRALCARLDGFSLDARGPHTRE